MTDEQYDAAFTLYGLLYEVVNGDHLPPAGKTLDECKEALTSVERLLNDYEAEQSVGY